MSVIQARVGFTVTLEQTEKIIQDKDKDSDGKIDYEEFVSSPNYWSTIAVIWRESGSFSLKILGVLDRDDRATDVVESRWLLAGTVVAWNS